MEFRQLGDSGLKVSALSFGAGTFGGRGDFFQAWGASDVAEATRLVSLCLEAGINLFDTADVYSEGLSEQILGKALAGRRHQVLISTKATFRMARWAERSRLFPPSSSRILRGQPAAPGHRLHRYLSDAWFRRANSRRRNAPYSGHAGRKRQGPLHRLFQFLRLAFDEVARRIAKIRLGAL